MSFLVLKNDDVLSNFFPFSPFSILFSILARILSWLECGLSMGRDFENTKILVPVTEKS